VVDESGTFSSTCGGAIRFPSLPSGKCGRLDGAERTSDDGGGRPPELHANTPAPFDREHSAFDGSILQYYQN